MEQLAESTKIQAVQIQIRPAEPEDVKASSSSLLIGKMYFLKSEISGKYSGPYYISDYTDIPEFTQWFKRGMVYVGISPLDNQITSIN